MPNLLTNGGHSAQVKIELLVQGNSVPVAQLGPDFLLLDKPFNHPPDNAKLILQVDEHVRRWNIRLPCGLSAGDNRVPLAVCAS
jgi:hypothetical protein